MNRYTHIVPYSAATTNKLALDHLKRYPWRWMLSPFRPNEKVCLEYGEGHAIDNGAFVYGKNHLEFNPDPFMKDVDKYGETADFVVIPDVLYDAQATLDQAEKWIERLDGLRLMIVAQDGMTEEDLSAFCARDIGVFIGGTTEFKLNSIGWISKMCDRFNVLCHVGRVNTLKRIEICVAQGAHSFDGSGPAIFCNTARLLTDRLIRYESDMFPRDLSKLLVKYFAQDCKQGLQDHAKLRRKQKSIVELYEEIVFPHLSVDDYLHITKWRNNG
tara:strand:+ start:4912 stop:5727 length:816 start_codon:yes stop_codon:yes gene_type:complete